MKRFNVGRLIIFILLGLILGTVLGVLIGKVFPNLNYEVPFGINPFTIKLVFLEFTFGIELRLNIGTIVGVIIFLYLYAVL